MEPVAAATAAPGASGAHGHVATGGDPARSAAAAPRNIAAQPLGSGRRDVFSCAGSDDCLGLLRHALAGARFMTPHAGKPRDGEKGVGMRLRRLLAIVLTPA